MSDIVVDSSVVAKWILPEADSPAAKQILIKAAASGDRLVVLDLAFPEVTNAIWKRRRQGLITADDARTLLKLLAQLPVHAEPATKYLAAGLEIAIKYDRSVYDALFIALAEQRGTLAITADEPLFNVTHKDIPHVALLRALGY